MRLSIIVKAPLNSAFSDQPTCEGEMSESDATARCTELNKTLRDDADYTYKVRSA